VRSFSRYVVIACWLGVLLAGPGWAVDRIDEFNKAKRGLQLQLRSKQPGDRVEALKALQEFPLADAVRMIHNSLGDPADAVHWAAYASLLKMSGNQEVCDTLLLMARKAVHRKGDNQAAAPLLAVLLSSDLPSVQRDTGEFLDKTGASQNGLPVVVALADELGNHHDKADVLPLVRLSKTKVFANHFGVRRAVVQALVRIPSAEAVGALIGMMDDVGGEAKADAVEHLTTVTGQIFAMDAAAWQRWWDESKETFEYPTRSIQTPYRSVAMNTASGYYYGLPLFAEKVVFVIDTSGSMAGPRIAAAKRELTRAIAGLADHVQFAIVAFNGVVIPWQKHLVQATPQAKKAAISFVNVQEVRSNTASYDALEAAFGFDTEAIYFLSDGAPHGGKIAAPVDIIAAVTAANQTRRISIYTIGIWAGVPGSPLDLFLKTLAEKNEGLYRRVDN
jgi:hypothetical protein